MRQPTRLALALAALWGVSTAAHAGLTTTLTAASDYLFDGVSQTDGGPALQGSLDYAFDNGIYVGTWASNVDYPDSPPEKFEGTEQDYYGGYYGSLSEGFDFDVGVARYTYHAFPESSDYTEWYAGVVIQGNTKLKYFYADDDAIFAGETWRVKLSHDVELNSDWKLKLEGTYTDVSELADAQDKDDESQWHYKVGLATAAADFNIEFGVQGTSKSDVYEEYFGYGDDNLDDTVYLLVSRTFELF